MDGEGVVLDANVNVLFVNAWDFDFQRDVVSSSYTSTGGAKPVVAKD
jgi:hypothetical protein